MTNLMVLRRGEMMKARLMLFGIGLLGCAGIFRGVIALILGGTRGIYDPDSCRTAALRAQQHGFIVVMGCLVLIGVVMGIRSHENFWRYRSLLGTVILALGALAIQYGLDSWLASRSGCSMVHGSYEHDWGARMLAVAQILYCSVIAYGTFKASRK